jgi:uncharacterized membrane protein YfcA
MQSVISLQGAHESRDGSSDVSTVIPGIAVGLIGGTLSGLTGLGGGFIMVPLLVYVFGMSQHSAQGTSLAVLLPPLGLLAFLQYYRNGHVDVRIAVLVALGFFFGGWLGGALAQRIPGALLRKGFALLLVAIAVDMFRR